MLSTENAKFKSAFERTNSQTTSDRQQKVNPIQILGIVSSFNTNINAFLKLFIFKSRVFIAVLSKS